MESLVLREAGQFFCSLLSSASQCSPQGSAVFLDCWRSGLLLQFCKSTRITPYYSGTWVIHVQAVHNLLSSQWVAELDKLLTCLLSLIFHLELISGPLQLICNKKPIEMVWAPQWLYMTPGYYANPHLQKGLGTGPCKVSRFCCVMSGKTCQPGARSMELKGAFWAIKASPSLPFSPQLFKGTWGIRILFSHIQDALGSRPLQWTGCTVLEDPFESCSIYSSLGSLFPVLSFQWHSCHFSTGL